MTAHDIAIQLLATGVGTLGFALLAHVRPRNIAAAVVGGVGGWALYLWIMYLTDRNIFVASLIAAMAVSIWSEVAARLFKAPVNIFMIPGIIPLLPGSNLYYMMQAVIAGDTATAAARGNDTILGVVGIVVGIVAASIFFVYLIGLVGARRNKTANNRTQSGGKGSI